MTDKPTPAAPSPSDAKAKPSIPKPKYVSGGQMLESPPLTARLSRFVDNAYNFFGLYLVSLFSLDPYAAAQNSQFNTRGPGRTSNEARSRWGAGTGSAGAGGSAGSGSARGGSGGGRGGGGGAGGRRLGTMDDVRDSGTVMPGPRACGAGGCG